MCWFFLGFSEALDFKFLLKPKDINSPCFVEEGPSRVLIGGALQDGARLASFKIDNDQVVEYRVFVQASRVSSFDLAASWRAYKGHFHFSAVRGIPDVSINSELQAESEVRFQLPVCFASCLFTLSPWFMWFGCAAFHFQISILITTMHMPSCFHFVFFFQNLFCIRESKLFQTL